ncbi:MAG: glutamate--tRNA ligase [Clostridia bacterium]|nr:glutamate--tRNA ligase [Clostridia bacterium]
MDDNQKLAELLFPDVTETVEDLERRFPQRALPEGAKVTRFAPSPTGFLHIGGLFSAFVDVLAAKSSGGVSFLRIEDTDKKREIADGVSGIIEGFRAFGVDFDEGVTGFGTEKGDYGPYVQSCRAAIYHVVAKKLVQEGLAYPCFCTEEELTALREKQEAAGTLIKGYFGEWAACRNLTFAQQEEKLRSGAPYVLRLRSAGDENRKFTFDDQIRGKIEMPENITDAVLLKTDGIPTYHFAHACDDHFMRVTHVIRGDEWIASVPLHMALFRACGFRPVKYVHVAPVMKEDEETGGKRKLSKRKDPEAAVSYFVEEGFPKEAVQEYLLTLINSNFEDWRRANPASSLYDFPFSFKKMSQSGALFDLVKLRDVSKNVISRMDGETVARYTLEWAKRYDPDFYAVISADTAYLTRVLSIDRGTAKPRKDISVWSEVQGSVSYLYDALFEPDYALPDNLSNADASQILRAWEKVYDAADDKDAWFGRIKDLCEPLGYTPNVKEYKKNPDAYRGHVGDVSTVIRVAVTGRRNTPDLHAILGVLGEARVRARIAEALAVYEQ